jgi:tRNA(Ile)-lysidine synthase
MDLPGRFLAFINKEKLFRKTDRLLLAVSGGLDSTVLCHLCYKSGFNFQIAHCNFLLRGEESFRDENFVKGLSEKYHAPFHLRRFDTKAYAEEQKLAIQVAARQLRYSFFSELTGGAWGGIPADPALQVADLLLTAHHGDDNVETVLMNLFKGTGISGLRGILPRKEDIVRPLLFARRAELLEFAQAENLDWVEDSSNSSQKYTRNRLRNETLPLLEAVYPAVSENVLDTINRLREVELIYKERIDQLRRKLVKEVGKEIRIPVLALKNLPAAGTLLYEISRDYGFTALQSNEMLALLDAETGKYVGSPTHRMIRHRNLLILTPVSAEESGIQVIDSIGEEVHLVNGRLRLSHCLPAAVSTDQKSGFFDADKVVFPLILRKRKQGDHFYPLGMRKKKKVSRFLSDLKLPAHEKDACWLLEMDKKIIWVAGMRIDDRYKVTPQTKQVLRIDFISNAS